MKDPVFSGRDVGEAVRLASRTLAVPESALRYVVLDPGQPGGRGLSATDARIAVLVERLAPVAERDRTEGRAPAENQTARRPAPGQRPAGDAAEPASGARALVQQIARSAGCDLDVDAVEAAGSLAVRVGGPGASLFFDPGGEVLAALEHVLERIYGRASGGLRVRVDCAGYREYRDEVLRRRAREMAAEVRADGRARTTQPLNSYERRVVHLALDGDPDVTTFSVGEGHARQVTLAPRAAAAEVAATGACAERSPQRQDVAGTAPPQDGRPATIEDQPAAVDAMRGHRPPEPGGASELM